MEVQISITQTLLAVLISIVLANVVIYLTKKRDKE